MKPLKLGAKIIMCHCNFRQCLFCDEILSFMSKDKKNDSELINLILLKKIGIPIKDKTYTKKILKKFLKKILIN